METFWRCQENKVLIIVSETSVFGKITDLNVVVRVMGYHRGVFKTQSNIYNGAFLP